ncbi:MAG: NUDIX hydrolase [Bacteroidetes bacterium]|nr:NUDIX hydrolase [Bacteroidota bacterium]
MHNYTFCPQCGQSTLEWDNNKKWNCNSCGFVLYHNVAGAVAVVVECDGHILLTKRNCNPAKGKLDLPGGFVDPKESAEETCARELWEELKWTIDTDKLEFITSLPNVYQYKEIAYNTLDLFFRYTIEERPKFLLEKSEIAAVVWLTKENLTLEDLAFESQKKFFKRFKE